jgi:peptidoglycan/LPS O-acetylase OafA/YrhL
MTRAPAQSEHRPDIDGLRAVAILSVLLFHASAAALPGGFVGVDIFFVISGFLISGIIFRGLTKDSSSYVDFYVRRIKRIFPALLVVLCAVWFTGWATLFTDEFQQLGKHIAAGAAFVSNVALWRESGYFDAAAESKPLLHLWSLGIEEQFYILWPVIAIVAWKLRIKLLYVIVALTVASFALNVGRVGAHESAVFYLPMTRAWELGIGALLAYWAVFESTKLTALVAPRRHAVAAAGALLLVVALTVIDQRRVFPGWWAALPTLGTVLLIAAGPPAWVNRVVLGNRAMVFVGLISYPLYLWHWPILSFLRVVGEQEPSYSIKAAAIAVTFVLAWLTYELIEKPIRYGQRPGARAAALLASVAAIGIVGYLSFEQIFVPRSEGYGLDKIVAAASAKMEFPTAQLKPLDDESSPLLEEGPQSTKILMMGDSYLTHYYPRIDRLVRSNPNAARAVVFAASGGCPPLPHVQEAHHAYCDGLVERGIAYALRADVDSVLIAANWRHYFITADEYRHAQYQYVFDGAPLILGTPSYYKALAAFQEMLAQLTKNGKRVFVLLQSPMSERLDPRRMVHRSLTDFSFKLDVPVVTRASLAEDLRGFEPDLVEAAASMGAEIIDPLDWLCDKETCPALSADGQPLYRDEGHLNPAFVREHVTFLDPLIEMPASALSAHTQ